MQICNHPLLMAVDDEDEKGVRKDVASLYESMMQAGSIGYCFIRFGRSRQAKQQ
jgi:hypothetical protein